MKFHRAFCAIMAALSAAALSISIGAAMSLPDTFTLTEGEHFSIENGYPVSATLPSPGDAVAAEAAQAGNSYNMDLRVWGALPVKQVRIDVVQPSTVIPCGSPFGIKMFTEGVVIIGLTDVDTAEGNVNPVREAGLRAGDIILSIDEQPVKSNEDVARAIEGCRGEAVDLVVRRKKLDFHVSVTPAQSATEKRHKLGAWIRDSSAGIGTLTFFDPDSLIFGGLGHGIADMDTGEILPLMSGEIVPVSINDIIPGQAGKPGELRGTFLNADDLGVLHENTETGVYGLLTEPPEMGDPVPVAMRQQIKEGPATILSTLDGEGPQSYEITIEKVNYNDMNPTRNMIIRVTDTRLLAKTGGIIQGMSGSPILQDGRLVGAVTHVLVNDPTSGYGIFAENMIKTAATVRDEALKSAS